MSYAMVELSSLCEIKTGKKDVNEGNVAGLYPFFTCAAKHTFSDSFSFDCEAILIAGNGAVGQTNYYKGKFEAYQRTYVLCNFKNILPRYLLYVLNGSLINTLSSMVLGNTIPYIKKGMLAEFKVPLPPLDVQQKLVAQLDLLFSEIDKISIATESNIKNSEALFQNYLTQVFFSIKDKTKIIKFGDLANFRNGINFRTASTGVPIKIFGVRNFKNHFEAPISDLDSINLAKPPPAEDLLTEGDILFVRSNGNLELIGRCVLFNKINQVITFSGFTIRARLTSKKILPKLLTYFLKSNEAKRIMIDSGNGANIKSLNQNTLGLLDIPVPESIELQEKLISMFEDFEVRQLRLVECYKLLNENLNNLRNSLVQKYLNTKLLETEL